MMMTVNPHATQPATTIDDADVKVLLLENIHADGRDFLRGKGYDVQTNAGALGEDELIEAIQGVHLLGIRSTTYITPKVLEAAEDLIAIGAFCIGTNQIDLEATSAKGVAVFNAPYSNTRSVVELAIAEIISLARRLHEKSTDMHRGVWNKSAAGSHEVRGRTLGIVGYGNIGSQLSVVAEALGFKVVFYDIDDKLALGNAQRCSTLEELLEQADVVTLHVDGRPGNAGLFGDEQMRLMKPRALFLNLSRGIAVDTTALRAHLESGHIAGAALDVFPVEPKRQGDPFESELRGIPNVILTPHVGGSTEEAQQDIGRFVASKLRSYAAFGSTSLSVNFPEMNLPADNSRQRIALVHQNAPGVLATINGLLGERGVNIEAQSLSTRGQLGYVVTDVAEAVTADVLGELAALPETVRLRQLS
ncbi:MULTISPECIES: phosphoglycerate dehydrogenase [unclassified Aeromicrobium]|uniref:phosphoglycerate dehydrogenase n=2 Tax=Aeromicrobium TaxID=2040 RepID=UPI0006F6FB28|nr:MULTISPECIES: phosphoglycerate dehydrogenase [unclassified Aeromicrobium]KQO36651.1 D-3-phosphoglycerate dehydrogenase [Aeromicrobium sp. Leaf245]KQP78140.1 D-3-phosphoglycerate dehydrogenase [Aeromicrobium sp. Leaf289]KQP83848.1 D-3-phosphoglycerate dehydrogenase [Aeromicrobium sp. Leaf291]RYY44319.1 MAG: phosphoglycerate dehydrogenase [Actinomycetales bacterium]